MPDTLTRFPARRQLPVAEIAAAIEALIEVLNKAAGDLDLEDDDPAESNGDEERAAWVEWDRMRGPSKRGTNFTLGDEDAEEDCEDCSGFEDEPLFEKRQCERLRAFYGDGPGGGSLLDSDLDSGEV